MTNKTAQSAHKGWTYKSKPKKEQDKLIKTYEIIIKWINKNKKIIRRLDDLYFYALKDDVYVTIKDIENLLGTHEEFTTKQFLYVYNNYNQIRRNLKYIDEFITKLSETLTEDDLSLILEEPEENINIFDEKYFDTYIYDDISPLSFNEIEQRDFEELGYYKTNDGKYIMSQGLF